MLYDLPEEERDFSTLTRGERFARRSDLVENARQAWEARYEFRARRRRSRDYFRGKQWEQRIDAGTGQVVDEAEEIRSQNRIPWVMNQVRPIINQLRGQFRQGYSDSIAVSRNREDVEADEMLTMALEQIHDINEVGELDADQFLECLLSGCFGWKIRVRWWEKFDRDEVTIDPVDQNRLFYNPDLADRRMTDLRFVGELHDWTLDEVIQNFARSEAEAKGIRDLYAHINPGHIDEFLNTWSGFDAADRLHWYWPADPQKCRVIELWKKEYRFNRYLHDELDGAYGLTTLSDGQIQQINQEREAQAAMAGLRDERGRLLVYPLRVDTIYEGVWTGYFLTPDGDVLWSGETPWWHDEHPFDLGFPVLVDGETWGMVEDIIDPQRLANRMTASIDFMFGIAAKGVLLIEEEAIPEGMTIDDIADEWTRFGGVIKFRARPGVQFPQQITANVIPAGILEWLAQQQHWMERISGVNGPVQGANAQNNTPASLYAAQIQQGQIANLDYFKAFYAARRRRDRKALQLATQYYDRRGVSSPKRKQSVEFDPERVQNLEMDVVLQDTQETATTRLLWENDLKELLYQSRITFRQYLEMSSHPKAPALLKIIEQTNPVLAGGPVTPELVEAAQAGDPDATAIINQAGDWGAFQQPHPDPTSGQVVRKAA